jgi:hypothetical protein
MCLGWKLPRVLVHLDVFDSLSQGLLNGLLDQTSPA